MIATTTPNAYDRHVLAQDGMPWPRRLWDVGALLALEGLWETGAWAAQRVLSPAACDWQRNELRAVIGPTSGSEHGSCATN